MKRAPGLLFAALAAAGIAAGSWWALRAGGGVPGAGSGQSAPSTPAAADPQEASGERPASTPRAPDEDRPLTASADAFAQYVNGSALAADDPLQAIRHFQAATRLDPDFAPAHYRLALAAVLADAPHIGEPAIRSALQLADRLPEPYRTTAEPLALFLRGAFDLLSQALPGALAKHPGDPDLNLLAGMLAACSCDHFDPRRVAAHMPVTLAADPSFSEARRLLAEARALLGLREPLPARHAAGERGRRDAVAERGRAFIAQGEIVQALEAADELLALGGDVPAEGLAPAFILSGEHDGLRALDDSEAESSRTIRQNVVARLHAGINDVWSGRFTRAAELFERGAEYARAPWQRADAARLLLMVGRARWLSGRSPEAAQAIEAALRLAPGQAVLEHALGVVHLRAGRVVEASRAAQRLGHERRRGQEGWTEPWRMLLEGEIALAAGDAAGALERIRKGWDQARERPVDCLARHADAWFLEALGRAEMAAGRPESALAAFDQVLALGPRALHQPELAVMALYRSGAALDELGRREAAADRLRRFVQLWGEAEGPPPEVADARRRLAAGEAAGSADVRPARPSGARPAAPSAAHGTKPPGAAGRGAAG